MVPGRYVFRLRVTDEQGVTDEDTVSVIVKHGKQYNELSAATGRFIMFSVITNIYNKKTKEPTLMELFTATGKMKKFFFDN